MPGQRQTLRAPGFGRWVRTQRKNRKRTLEDVARSLFALRVKCGSSKLEKIEKEGRVPGVDVLWGLSQVYDIPIHHLMNIIASDLGLGQSGAVHATEQEQES